jgi:benzoyl-CoA 2,3-dioxygenase component B
VRCTSRDWSSDVCSSDLDGKYQLKSLAESAFDPLARTTQFMLTEEAHHMFVGETGLARVLKRTQEVIAELGTDDPAQVRAAGAIDFPTFQRYLNFSFSSSLDLFGSEISSNAASSFATGLKGRPDEQQYADHRCVDTSLAVEVPDGGGIRTEDVPMRNAMNEVLRTAYVRDCELGLKRWNRQLERSGIDFRVTLPSSRFNRAIGVWASVHCDPAGQIVGADAFANLRDSWLPSAADRAFVRGLMQRVVAPGRMAAWLAPPERGINNLAIDYEYVRLP